MRTKLKASDYLNMLHASIYVTDTGVKSADDKTYDANIRS